MNAINIAGRKVGDGSPAMVIAELSCNHLGSLERAKTLLFHAKHAGADAAKTQAYDADSMVYPNTPAQWHGQNLYDLYREAAMPWEWHKPLKEYADHHGLLYFASVFDQRGIDLMEGIGVPAYKVASFELVDLPLIRALGKIRKPIILSTGMAERWEIQEALASAHEGSRDRVACAKNRVLVVRPPIALLQCTSAYPASGADANLATMQDMRWRFSCPVGVSDHTIGIAVPVAAVALGASIVEKHLTLSRADGGPDAAFSLEPTEFRQMVDAIRVAERALGEVKYGPNESERESVALRRSLWVVQDVRAGDAFTEQNIRSLRPADGLAPRHLPDVLGRRARVDIASGTALQWEMVA